jgi:hypothetical protein
MRADDWQSSGTLARSCHTLLSLFLRPEILKEIVWRSRNTGVRLLRWLTLSLPAHCFPSFFERLVPFQPPLLLFCANADCLLGYEVVNGVKNGESCVSQMRMWRGIW